MDHSNTWPWPYHTTVNGHHDGSGLAWLIGHGSTVQYAEEGWKITRTPPTPPVVCVLSASLLDYRFVCGSLSVISGACLSFGNFSLPALPILSLPPPLIITLVDTTSQTFSFVECSVLAHFVRLPYHNGEESPARTRHRPVSIAGPPPAIAFTSPKF